MAPHFIKNFFLFSILSFTLASNSWAKLNDFQTTRLISTAGAGSASILMDEATLLNPAPLAFFNVTSFYIQKHKADLSYQQPSKEEKLDNWNFIASDGNESLGASFSYLTEKIEGIKKKRMGLAFGFPAEKSSSLGVSVSRLTVEGLSDKKETYYQTTLGVSHVLNPSFAIGFVAQDIFNKTKEDTRAVIGLQYTYEEFITLLGDLGGDYTKTLSENIEYRLAAQFRVLSDLFLRVGYFDDQSNHERGVGFGLGWVTPKLVLELGMSNKKLLPYEKRITNIKVQETSFSLSYRF